MEIKNHVIQGIKFIESPNQNERPNHPQISLIVIHSISLPPKKYNNDAGLLIVGVWLPQ